MSRGIIDAIIGGVEIAAGIALEFVPGGQYFGYFLIAAGIGMVLTGVGTLLSGNNLGVVTASRNPIKPWDVVYGRARACGSIIIHDRDGGDE